MTRPSNDLGRGERLPSLALLPALTTEHFTLQTARNATIAETSSRTALFMGTVTGSVVALALVGQMSSGGPAFGLFALTMLPTVLALGLMTYARLVETALEDLAYARAIETIRGYYVGLDPLAAPYLLMSHGPAPGPGPRAVTHDGRFHLLGHAATTVAAVDGVLAGAVAALALHQAGVALGASGAAALSTAGSVVLGLYVHQARRWRRASRSAWPGGPRSEQRGDSG